MVFEIRGSSLLLGHVFAPNLCITPGYCIIVGSVILPNIKIVFYCHANKTHSHVDVFYTLPRFESEDIWNLEIA